MVVFLAWLALVVMLVYSIASSLKRVAAGERLVVYRGRREHRAVDGPATVLIVPFLDRAARVPAGDAAAHRIEP